MKEDELKGEAKRLGRFSGDEALKLKIKDMATAHGWGAQRIWKALPATGRPSTVTIQGMLNEEGLGSKAERTWAKDKAIGKLRADGVIATWTRMYIETKAITGHGKPIHVTYAFDGDTARVRATWDYEYSSGKEGRLFEEIRTTDFCFTTDVWIGRGGKKRRKIIDGFRRSLERLGVKLHHEGRWGMMTEHRKRFLGIIEKELSYRYTIKEAIEEAVKRYNEMERSQSAPCFGYTPDETWVKLQVRKRKAVLGV